jgi:hypothetical protein
MADEFINADELPFHIVMVLAEVTPTGQQPDQCQKQKVRVLHAGGHITATRWITARVYVFISFSLCYV